jgi:hypothetical protein
MTDELDRDSREQRWNIRDLRPQSNNLDEQRERREVGDRR